MKLMTKEVAKKIPALYSQEEAGLDAIAHVKLFYPAGAATWYLSEYDPETGLAFGWADLTGSSGELGYVSIPELQEFRGRFGLGIERDIHWTPRPLRECRGVAA